MSLLKLNAAAAEIALGCSFSENFENRLKVVQNKGVISGTPEIDFGVVLNGSTDYLSYPAISNLTNVFTVSAWIYSAATQIDNAGICGQGSGGNPFWFIGLSSDRLFFRVNDGIDNAYATPASLIVPIGKWTHIMGVLNGKGATNLIIYQNGVEVDTSDSTDIDSVFGTENLRIGKQDRHGSLFNGQIRSLKIWNRPLYEQDAINYSNQTTFRYIKPVIHLPMRAAQHDPSNNRTLDISGNEYHANFGAGAAEPTKLQKRGYGFDGGDYLNCGNVIELNNTTKFTATFLLMQNAPDQTDYFFSKYLSSDNFVSIYTYTNGNLYIDFKFGGTNVYTWLANYKDYLAPNSITSVFIVYDGSGSGNADKIKIFFNGKNVPLISFVGTIPSQLPDLETADLLLGKQQSQFFEGNFYDFRLHKQSFTPLKIAELHIEMMQELDRV